MIEGQSKQGESSRFAQRVQSLAPEGAYFMLAKAQALEAAGRTIIHLEIGEPDFDTESDPDP